MGHLATKAFFFQEWIDINNKKRHKEESDLRSVSVLLHISWIFVFCMFTACFCCHQVVKSLPLPPQLYLLSSKLIFVSRVITTFYHLLNKCSSLIQSFHLSITNRHISLANSPVPLVQSSPGRFPSSSSCGFAQSIPCIKQERILFIKEKTELKYKKRF